MSNPLTGEYELMAQLSGNVASRLLQAAYLREKVPHRLPRFEFDGEYFDVILHDPNRRLVPSLHFGSENEVSLTFPVSARATPRNAPSYAITGHLTIVTTVKKSELTRNVSTSQDESFITISFNDIPRDRFALTVEGGGTGDIRNALLEKIFFALVTLRDPQLILSPGYSTGPNSVARFDVRTVQGRRDEYHLVLLMRTSGSTEVSAPDPILPLIERGKDFALAIPSEFIKSKFRENMFDHFRGRPPESEEEDLFPAQLPEDPSVTIKSLDFTFEEGHLHFRGAAKKEIDNWWDANIEFAGPVQLLVRDGRLAAFIDDRHFHVDAPWWSTFVAFLIPVVGLGIHLSIIGIIKSIIGEAITGNVSESFDELTGFSRTIPKVGESLNEELSFEVRSDTVTVKPAGLIIHGTTFMPLMVANRRTRELHLPSDRKWIDRMSFKNKGYIQGLQEALDSGYNGCWYCLRFLDTDVSI